MQDQGLHGSAHLKESCPLKSIDEKNHLLPSPARIFPRENPQDGEITTNANDRKRKLQPEPEEELCLNSARKKTRASLSPPEKASRAEVADHPIEINPINHWRREGSWPKIYFELDDKTIRYISRDLEEESWLRQNWEPGMEHVLARNKSSSSIRRILQAQSSSEPNYTTSSDQKPREVKSTQYKQPGYPTLLEERGIFMNDDSEGPKAESKDLLRNLLNAHQTVPEMSRFSDDVFESTCRRIQNRNEAKVIDKIARLIVPSAEDLADSGSKSLQHLVESIDEGWNRSIPVTRTRPQPDYAVGFGRSAFTETQLSKLRPFVGGIDDTSYFMATHYMYFPFFTCEVKCGAAALEIADRQNVHSMTLAVRGIVEMFKLVKREKEVDREFLAFSVSHDNSMVKIYGHYPVIENKKTRFYRRLIHEFSFVTLEGKEKWTAYKFTKNVYDVWMPKHFERLCSVIEELPSELSFEVSEQSNLQFQESGLSQELQTCNLPQQSNPDTMSFHRDRGDSQASTSGLQDATPDTSISQYPGSFKKARKGSAME